MRRKPRPHWLPASRFCRCDHAESAHCPDHPGMTDHPCIMAGCGCREFKERKLKLIQGGKP